MSLRLELDESFKGSVGFTVDRQTRSSTPHVENNRPYSLMGDDNVTGHVDYRGWRATVGQHIVHIRVFTGKDLSGEELCSRDVPFVVVSHPGAIPQATVYSSSLHPECCTVPERHLDGLAECSEAGGFLGLTHEPAQVNFRHQIRRPHGCTWDEGRAPDGSRGGYLRWNSLGQLNMHDAKRRCICKTVTPANLTSSSTPPTRQPTLRPTWQPPSPPQNWWPTPSPTPPPTSTSEPPLMPTPTPTAVLTQSPTLLSRSTPRSSAPTVASLTGCSQFITMSVVDAVTNDVLMPLGRATTVNLAALDTDQITVVLEWNGSRQVRTVDFYLDGETRTQREGAAPWVLFGDNGREPVTFTPWTADPTGPHTIHAELFPETRGRGGLMCQVDCQLMISSNDAPSPPPIPAPMAPSPQSTPSPTPITTTNPVDLVVITPPRSSAPTVASSTECSQFITMSVVDAVTNDVLMPLGRATTVNLAALDTDQITVVLEWNGSRQVRTVDFYLDGETRTQREGAAPWVLFGDNGREPVTFTPWTADPTGPHTIHAELFPETRGRGGLMCQVDCHLSVLPNDEPGQTILGIRKRRQQSNPPVAIQMLASDAQPTEPAGSSGSSHAVIAVFIAAVGLVGVAMTIALIMHQPRREHVERVELGREDAAA